MILSAEELLKHALISDRENYEILYILSAIYYELREYELCLKHIREAIEYSEEHMVKYYYLKANAKLLLGRYEEAIKDYSNAEAVFNEQKGAQQPQLMVN